jgi:arylsulfatase A-like enzyme
MNLKKLIPYAGAVLAAGFLFGLSEAILSLIARPDGAPPAADFAPSLAHRCLFYTVAMASVGAFVWLAAAALRVIRKRESPSPARAAAAAMLACVLTSDIFWTVVGLLNPKRIVLFGHKLLVWQPTGFATAFLGPLVIALFLIAFALYKVLRRIKKPRRIMTFAGSAAVVGWLVTGSILVIQRPHKPAPVANYPDVFLITLDAWRADTFGPRDNGATPTPNIDRFAEGAYVFRNARSQASWTLPSFSTIFTSQYPAVHGAAASRPLGTNQPTLAEILASRGYDTRAVVANELCLPNTGVPRGFDDYHYWNMVGWLKSLGFYETNFSYPVRKLREEKKGSRITTVLTEATLARLERRGARPVFLWLHYLDPHGPYWPPPEYADAVARTPLEDGGFTRDERGVILRARYDAEVRYVDAELDRILQILERRPNSVVIISSDHGEEFLEHGGFDHGHTVYDELLRVPLIMKFPERGAGEVQTPVSTIDVAPTILDYLGVEAPASMQGRSLWPIIYDTEDERPSFAGPTQLKGSSKEALYYKGKKFIYDYKYPKAGAWYDIESDPGEHLPHAPTDPEGARLWELLASWREINREFRQHYWAAEDAGAIGDAMRAMGYVQ